MSIIEGIIFSTLDNVQYVIISHKLISGDKKFRCEMKKIISYSVVILIAAIMMGTLGEYLISTYSQRMLSATLLICMTFLLYRRKLKETIYIYGIATIIMLLIQFGVFVTFNHLGKDLAFNFKDGITAHSMILPLSIMVKKYIPIDAMFTYINKNNKIFGYLVLNAFIILISLLSYWYIDIDGIFENITAMTVILILIIVINFILVKNGLKNKLEEEKLRTYEGNLPSIDELIKDLRKKQHECDNHIQKLRMLAIRNEDNDSGNEVIKEEDIKEDYSTRR